MTAVELFSHLRSLDVKLWLDGDRLRYSAPKGVLSQALLEELAENKKEIRALLRKATDATSSAPSPIQRVARDKDLPLSFAQERLWLMDQLASSNPAYNISPAIRFRGLLNVAALAQTLNEIVRRHEILRTTFQAIDGNPSQVIAQAFTGTLRLVDLQTIPEAEREFCMKRLASLEAKRPFDLTQGPLRMIVVRLTAEDHVLFFTMHHIISDAWSCGLFVREVTAFYEAFSSGDTSLLAEPVIQYADFAHWQRERLQGEVLEKQLVFWKRQLEDAPVLEMPTDRQRPPVQSFRGATKFTELSDSLSMSLNELSRRNGVTLFMTLLAAFKTLLHRYSNQDDIIVGTSVANRNRLEVKELIGFFVNTLVLRTKLSGDPTVAELLKRVREVTLKAHAHQDLPFDLLVSELQPERDMSRNPLFQVLFMLQNTPESVLKMQGLSQSRLESAHNTAQFDLSLSAKELRGKINLSLIYNTDLFDGATITRLMGHFEVLLEAFVANSQARLSTLPLLTEEERYKQLVEWNQTYADYSKDECLHVLIERQAEITPNSVAVVCEHEQLTYCELNRRANQLAHYLQRIGVAPETRVGILMERSVEMLVGLLGILKAGGAYVPLDPAFPNERRAFILKETAASVLVTVERLADKSPETGAQVVRLDADCEMFARESAANPVSFVKGDNLVYVIYTSGSTGKPKGVMITHRGLVNYLRWAANYYAVTKESCAPVHSSIAFDLTVTGLFSPLMVGGRVILIPEDQGVEGLAAAMLRDQYYTLIKITPAHLQALSYLLPAEQLAGRARALVIGGEALYSEPLSLWFEQACETRLINEYGPTETVVGCCVYEVRHTNLMSLIVPIGRPVANTQCYLLNGRLREVPIGVTGELYIGGDGAARGYLNRPELTAEKFTPNPFSEAPGTWMYKSGDLGRYLPDGDIEYLGRMDQQVKIRGFRIELGEIEAVLKQRAGVREALVWAREDTPGDKRLVAYIVPEQEAQPPVIAQLQNDLREKLPGYMIPSAFVILRELPLSPNGKVNRQALPPPGQTVTESEEEYAIPLTEVEQTIAALWRKVLRVERVEVNDNFFEMGGNSLLMIQLYRSLIETFGGDLAITDLLRYPTISSLAGYINKNDPPPATPEENDNQAAKLKQGLNRLRHLKERTTVAKL